MTSQIRHKTQIESTETVIEQNKLFPIEGCNQANAQRKADDRKMWQQKERPERWEGELPRLLVLSSACKIAGLLSSKPTLLSGLLGARFCPFQQIHLHQPVFLHPVSALKSPKEILKISMPGAHLQTFLFNWSALTPGPWVMFQFSR